MSNGYELNYGLISKYRTVMMGIAIIFIMFCHLDVAQTHNGMSKTALAGVLHTLTVGVDIFLFLSGIGLYYSYTKRNQTYGKFEKKRMLRILPFYFVIGGLTYFVYDIVMNHFTIGKFLSDFLFISWFRDGSTKYWYILAITVFYLLFPIIYRFIHTGQFALLKLIGFSFFWWIAIGLLCHLFPETGNFRRAIDRLPVFMIGIYCGKLSYNQIKIRKKTAIFFLICGYLLFSASKIPFIRPFMGQMYYTVRAFLGFSVISTVIFLMELAKKRRVKSINIIMKTFSWFGENTLELYLLHQSFMILFNYPYHLALYVITAFILPTTTGLICSYRKKIDK